MSTENKPVNAGKPWDYQDILLVARTAPNWDNADALTRILGRSHHAIQYLWSKLYMSTTDLKKWAEVDTSKSEQAKKILKARRETRICINK